MDWEKYEKMITESFTRELALLHFEMDVLRKALELACDYVKDEWEGTKFDKDAMKFGGFENFFIKIARDILNENHK